MARKRKRKSSKTGETEMARMPASGHAIFCVHCLGIFSARFLTDKKGRPFIRCTACGSTSFLPTGAALRGTITLASSVTQAAQQVAGLGYGDSLDEMTKRAEDAAAAYDEAGISLTALKRTQRLLLEEWRGSHGCA